VVLPRLSGIPCFEGGFPLRCLQRLSCPIIATQHCYWHNNCPPVDRSPRSSRTRGNSSQVSYTHGRLGTELSHDVLNPAHVPPLNGEQPYPWDLPPAPG